MDSILFQKSAGLAQIVLNRPEKFNAFCREMALRFQAVLDECEQDEAIRAIYLTGAGKAFCAGQDLAEVVDPNGPGMQRILAEHYNPIVQRMRKLPKPIVVAVNGVAAGAGANIALAGDVVVAAASASFLQAFSKIGLIPDSGGTFTLPRLIGFQRASALMLLGDKVSAADAWQMGMLYKVLPDEVFAADSLAIAQQLATMPTQALAYTKEALNLSLQQDWDSQLATEDRLQQAAAATADFKEGVAAFLAKRPPLFTGK